MPLCLFRSFFICSPLRSRPVRDPGLPASHRRAARVRHQQGAGQPGDLQPAAQGARTEGVGGGTDAARARPAPSRRLLTRPRCLPPPPSWPVARAQWNVCVVGSHELWEHPHINDLAYIPAFRDGELGYNISACARTHPPPPRPRCPRGVADARAPHTRPTSRGRLHLRHARRRVGAAGRVGAPGRGRGVPLPRGAHRVPGLRQPGQPPEVPHAVAGGGDGPGGVPRRGGGPHARRRPRPRRVRRRGAAGLGAAVVLRGAGAEAGWAGVGWPQRPRGAAGGGRHARFGRPGGALRQRGAAADCGAERGGAQRAARPGGRTARRAPAGQAQPGARPPHGRPSGVHGQPVLRVRAECVQSLGG